MDWAVKLWPPDYRPRARAILSKVRLSLLSWLKGRLASMAIVGALSMAALYLIGIPAVVFLGLFAGLVEFVPYFGPVVAAVPPLLLALAHDPVDGAWVILAYFVIQQAESNLITPLLIRGTTSLHPAAEIIRYFAL